VGLETTLAHAVGMYAFALWDRAERRLRLVRDRFGEKPLYYGWTRDAFVFGSELDALRAYPGFDNAIDPDVVRHKLFEAFVEPKLEARDRPVFVHDYPAGMCPLTKRKAGSSRIAERFELYIHGMEIANAYTELNDPITQEATFRRQLAGLPQDESMAKMDEDFVRALRHGMPPAGGLGIGIDRLVMLLTNTTTIRDVILFPLLRPEKTN